MGEGVLALVHDPVGLGIELAGQPQAQVGFGYLRGVDHELEPVAGRQGDQALDTGGASQ